MTDSTKKILICSTCKFPDSDAPSVYNYGISLLFKQHGYKTDFIGFSSTKYKTSVYSNELNGNLTSIKRFNSSFILFKIINHIFLSSKMFRIIKKNVTSYTDFLITGNHNKNKISKILAYIKMKNPTAKIYMTAVEEYSKIEFCNPSILILRSIKDNNYFINEFSDTSVRIIAISDYLYDKFAKRGFKCMKIPHIFSSKCLQNNTHLDNKKTFIYAGTPSNKDKLKMMLVSFSSLSELEKNKIKLLICGVTKDWLLSQKDGQAIYNSIASFTHFYGYINKKQIDELYKASDFSILLRDPDALYAKAGFPTKIAESFTHGIPPISNITSDLKSFLTINNSIIVDNYTNDSFCNAIRIALSKTDDELLRLKKQTSKDAIKFFTIDSYYESFLDFCN